MIPVMLRVAAALLLTPAAWAQDQSDADAADATQTPPTDPEQVAVEHFARLPAFSSPAVSPDGARVAFLREDGELSLIGVLRLADKHIDWINVGDQKARSVRWASDDAVLITVSMTSNFFQAPRDYAFEFGGVFHVRLDSEEPPKQLLTDSNRIGQNVSLAQIEAIDWDRGRIYMSARGRLGRNMNYADVPRLLYAVDAETGRSSLAETGDGDVRGWIFDDRSRPAGRVGVTRSGRYQTIESSSGGGYREVRRSSGENENLSVLGMAPEGDEFVVAGGGNRNELRTFDLETGEETSVLLSDGRREILGARRDPYTNRVVAGRTSEDEGSTWFDDDLAQWEEALKEALPDDHVSIVSWSRDRSVMIVSAQNTRHPVDHYVFDRNSMELDFLSSAYPELRLAEMPAREAYGYEARDGVRIPGYLTAPESDDPLPLVILPHGGPATRETAGFDWMAHALASRGYAVLQPNFRGSSGFGRDWEYAGHGEWGLGVMQHDLTDGVRALVEEGRADPERVCIAGASYGGYAALAGAAFTPDLYACAVAIAPVSDLVDFVRLSSRRGGYNNPTTRYWRKAMSDGRDSRYLADASPARRADDVQAPVLLLHGEDDTVVPIDQSRAMERALRRAGKPVEFVPFEGEDHWLSVNESRVATLTEMVDFIDAHIGHGSRAGR